MAAFGFSFTRSCRRRRSLILMRKQQRCAPGKQLHLHECVCARACCRGWRCGMTRASSAELRLDSAIIKGGRLKVLGQVRGQQGCQGADARACAHAQPLALVVRKIQAAVGGGGVGGVTRHGQRQR